MQERDECSEEITRMRVLEEKFEAEISQLAKDSQVVPVSHVNTVIAIGHSWSLYGTFRQYPKMIYNADIYTGSLTLLCRFIVDA